LRAARRLITGGSSGIGLATVERFVQEGAQVGVVDLHPPPGGQAGGGGTSGKSIFAANCASCHTLKAAGATGTVGPNLDGLKPSFARAKHQVINGGAVMPAFKGKLSDKQIDAVARFVADSAGK